MKRIVTFALAISAIILAVSACKKDDTPSVPTYSVTVKVAVDNTYPVDATLPVYEVIITNTSTGVEKTGKTENGVVKFTGMISGTYSVKVSGDSDYFYDTTLKTYFVYHTVVSTAQPVSVLQDETINLTASFTKVPCII